MPDIILLDGRGEPTTYSGIKVVEFDTVDGERAQFHNLKFSDVEVELDFSESDQIQVEPEEGEVFQKVTVNKPSTLLPENIMTGVTIAGVPGELIPQADTPTIGFLPYAWDGEGYAIEGTWYGESVPVRAFYNNPSSPSCMIQKLVFSDAVKTINQSAFYNCSSLQGLILPDSVTSIGNTAFYNCQKMGLAKLPDNLISIGDSAFSSCSTGITAKSIPAGVTSIGTQSFYNCGGLTELTFYGTPLSIADSAFMYCSNLKTIKVPWSVGEVKNAPWGATAATIEYDCFSDKYAMTLTSLGGGLVEGKDIGLSTRPYTAKIIPEAGNVISALTDNGVNVLSSIVDFYNAMPTYTVASAIGASFAFHLNENGYYESQNKSRDNSASVSVVTFNLPEATTINIEYINSGEGNFDFGIFSEVDKSLSVGSDADTANVYKSCKGESSTEAKTLTYNMEAGEHFIYIKYRKDSSGAGGNDSLQFKILPSPKEMSGGNPADYAYSTYTIERVAEDHIIEATFAPAT